jgi:hypothetical protein
MEVKTDRLTEVRFGDHVNGHIVFNAAEYCIYFRFGDQKGFCRITAIQKAFDQPHALNDEGVGSCLTGTKVEIRSQPRVGRLLNSDNRHG